ncbi:hypothetical protein QBC34DRAFT_465675 [Podospora aff. communis PSN243]|uniref:Uncharacterized protein n=1 Tax=Podospora aff. communis PSN243 TaxID=3040156 RepID=A0AAV9GLZ8_9PEZI|nr:hypothetical protein QBC34DRAFT_465675 [Podospora aff. communis PSN243]
MQPQTSRSAFLVVLLSSALAVNAQSACGLQGFTSCSQGTTRTTGYGCCPTGYECFATECEYTGTPTSTSVAPAKTECPGVPAHHLCAESIGGGCCHNAYACNPDNASQCTLTKTERVFDEVVTTTTVVDGATQTITSTSIFYPWQTAEPRRTPGTGSVPSATQPLVTRSSRTSATATGTVSTVSSESPARLSTSTQSTSTTASTAAAGHAQARIGGVIGGIVAGILAQ